MKSQPIESFFFFGTCVRFLQDISAGSELSDSDTGWGIRTNLRKLTEYISELNLQVAARHHAFHELQRLLKELDNSADDKISVDQATRLNYNVSILRGVLDAELRGLQAYTTSPKRYDIKVLTSDISSLFAPGIYTNLPSIAQFDLREAGVCLAFERATASAFHLMRATEATLCGFYQTLVKRKRCRQFWGDIVNDLRQRKSAAKHRVLLDNLDNIRDSFRNPTQHPEATYTVHAIEDLWGLCIDAINRMGKVLPPKSSNTASAG